MNPNSFMGASKVVILCKENKAKIAVDLWLQSSKLFF